MLNSTRIVAAAIFALAVAGCGLFYQVGTRVKAGRIADSLQAGQTMLDTHRKWGEPDLRQYLPGDVEIWSYPYKPNTNDVTASLLYTSTKEGDAGTFLDLKFVGGKLVSWSEVEHTMPSKERSGFGAGLGAPPIEPPAGAHY
ncbi:MAG TPA: hypothetical protein VEC38_07135 [Candidatus Binataceae bacterium]|nr:hypothetical protein [Candidatus Binataceae bacterium]